MNLRRRDVIEVVFGSNTKENHSVIVLSPQEVNIEEESFLGIMITDTPHYDPDNEFSFPLNDSMFMKPLKEKQSRVRLYLINFLLDGCVVNTKINEMKSDSFKKMIQELNKKIFGVSFE